MNIRMISVALNLLSFLVLLHTDTMFGLLRNQPESATTTEAITVAPSIISTPPPYIDDPIVLRISVPLTPTLVLGDEVLFDFDHVPLVKDGTYNDFDIIYETASSCDSNAWAFNYQTSQWDQFGFAPPAGYFCLWVISTQGHLFSARSLEASNYLNAESEMRLRGLSAPAPRVEAANPRVRALRINPYYTAIPVLVPESVDSFDGLTYDGQTFWVSSNLSNKLYNITSSGTLLKELDTPSAYPFGLAFDGQDLWLADGTDRIFKLTTSGNVLCAFSVPTDYPWALAWGNGKLWLSEYAGQLRLFGIDPDTSCNSGIATITDVLPTPGGHGDGLAWDGTHLLVASDKLYRLTTGGIVTGAYNLSVESIAGAVWDGQAVWLLNAGPKDTWGHDPVIARFRLRPLSTGSVYLPLVIGD